MEPDEGYEFVAARRPLGAAESARAARRWWDRDAGDYQAEHGEFLGDTDFVWCPEGVREGDVGLLGARASLVGARVLEVGCGAAQAARWLRARGVDAVGIDISAGQLAHSSRLDARSGIRVPVIQADAAVLPFPDGCFDLACSAYGALPFVADAGAVHAEVARVVRPGGRWVFSVTHPVRWMLRDDPGPGGLEIVHSYFDRDAYVELDDDGLPAYVEHHRTIGDQVRALVAGGWAVLDIVEPEWPSGHDRPWGGWSPLRGTLVPGTAIFVCQRVGSAGQGPTTASGS